MDKLQHREFYWRWLVAIAKQAAQVSDALAGQTISFALMLVAAWRIIVVTGLKKTELDHGTDKYEDSCGSDEDSR